MRASKEMNGNIFLCGRIGLVNYLAHVAVALACDLSTDEEVLGAILPDLASMADVRFDKELLPAAVGRGIVCHYATDTAFHAHPTFVAGSEQIRERLARQGVASGPRRAVAHVGWELLLDGGVAVLPGVVDSFATALSGASVATGALSEADRTRWTCFATEMVRRRDWEHYRDPAFVAARIRLILKARPRLALREQDMNSVLGALEELGGKVANVSSTVVSDVARAVLTADVRVKHGP